MLDREIDVIGTPTVYTDTATATVTITVNGVSLTVNEVEDHDRGCEISINLIPHTVQVTTLKHLAASAQVNLEIDMIARYVERMVRQQHIPV